MFEAVEYTEIAAGETPIEVVLGAFSDEEQAVASARGARFAFSDSDREGYAWWIVREQGARFALWIADNRSDREYTLDIRTGELSQVR